MNEKKGKKRAPILWNYDPEIFKIVAGALLAMEPVLDINKKTLCFVSYLESKGITLKYTKG